MIEIDRQTIFLLLRLGTAIVASLAFYFWIYAYQIAGPLRPLIDAHFAYHAIKDLTIHLTGAFLGALLISIVPTRLGFNPAKGIAKIAAYRWGRSSAHSTYRLILANRKLVINIVLTLITLLNLQLWFIGSLFYLIQFFVGAFFCLSMAIAFSGFYFGIKRNFEPRLLHFKSGQVLLVATFAVFLLVFTSFNLASGRQERLASGPAVEIQIMQKNVLATILGATAEGIFIVEEGNRDSVSYLPLSQIIRIRAERQLIEN